jgi:hypothetical protein
MQFVIGGLIFAIGLALIIAGAEGSGANLFQAVTGKAPAGSSTTSGAASALDALAKADGTGTGSGELGPGNGDDGTGGQPSIGGGGLPELPPGAVAV